MTETKNPAIPLESTDSPWYCLSAMLFTAMAAGLGWGIRGQYGHESGAMIAGAMASVTLMLFFARNASAIAAARAAAMATVAIGIGGCETYAQSVGLTHDPQFVGNWAALRWGMLGLFIKGGIWIGFFGVFLGMGLGGKRYKPLEICLLVLALIGLVFAGRWLINSPFDPSNKILPRIYFSSSWYFEPDRVDLKPRPEIWGGLITALLGLVAYAGLVRRDRLAVRLAIWAFVAGGIGQAGGQCIQSFHSWNPDLFSKGALSGVALFKEFNWWNMMETGFGCVFGAIVALGVWFNRRLIAIDRVSDDAPMGPTLEIALCSLHLVLLLTAEFLKVPDDAGGFIPFWIYVDYGLIMCLIPLVGISGGRFWPFLQLLVVVAAPIMGKEMRELCFRDGGDYPPFPETLGWLIFVMAPMAILVTIATGLITRLAGGLRSTVFGAVTLLAIIWLFFGLNTFFFGFAWPWEPLKDWTYRTPNQLIFMVFTGFLSVLSLRFLITPGARAVSRD